MQRFELPIPTYDKLLRPLLAYASENDISRRSATDAMAEHFGLTQEEREARVPSGSATYIRSRTGWAMSFLSKPGFIEKVARATYRITPAGRDLLVRFPDTIRLADLDAMPIVRDAWHKREDAGADQAEASDATLAAIVSDATPDDRIDQAIGQINAVLRGDLLAAILDRPPRFFEDLVLDVLKAMNYGTSGPTSLQHTGGSGDEGIDGVINEDALGLNKIMLQAKRYRPDRGVDRHAVQAFVGALVMKGVDRGVFITTSYFVESARELVSRPNGPKVALIDGSGLLDFMIEHGVGVRVKRSIPLRELDKNYFDDE